MNLLIDTNIFIPLEPTSMQEAVAGSASVAILLQTAQTVHAGIFIHPEIIQDIQRDPDLERQGLHMRAISKYRQLPAPPHVATLPRSCVPASVQGTNDWVDNCLIAAVYGNACDFLVTEDQKMHSKARKLGIAGRVLFLQDALDLLSTLADHPPTTKPNVEFCYFHEIDCKQPFFDSLRADYPEFDDWFAKSARNHRQAFVIREKAAKTVVAIAAIKEEDALPDGARGKILKLCTLKVCETHMGMRYGELLLSSVCEYCHKGRYTHAYFTAFPRHEALLSFAETFGFERVATANSRGEHAYVKRLVYGEHDECRMSAVEFYKAFGPQVVTFARNKSFIVPIQPRFLVRLWPELDRGGQLFAPEPCGNSIRKAYLCHSSTKLLRPGDNLLFYRSQEQPAVVTIGTVESVTRTCDAAAVIRRVGSRTVYSMEQVADLCRKRTLVILFRNAETLSTPISLIELRRNGAIPSAPQSIIQVAKEAIPWLKQRVRT